MNIIGSNIHKTWWLKWHMLSGPGWLMPLILANWETEIGRIPVWGQLRQIVQEILFFKTTRAKWTGGVAQAAKCLPCKCTALSSNTSPIKKKQKRRSSRQSLEPFPLAGSIAVPLWQTARPLIVQLLFHALNDPVLGEDSVWGSMPFSRSLRAS
jgi:hypothetical protein